MEADKRELIDSINRSVKELQKGIDIHCCLVTSILEGRMDERNLRPLMDLCPKRSRELMLENAIKETIDELEESRKAFKSKRLESLRKRLAQVLISSD
ncbi:MAG: hypothetical protein PHN98_08365 [Smithellaceae bacterium]|nr:hypothetical protein [Smithellaceae bacterium]